MPPVEEAKDIFSRLGYAVSGDGTELLAERKWRTVRVTAMDADAVESAGRVLTDGGESDRLRCFVTWEEYTGDLRERLERVSPPYEWAIIGVRSDDRDYEVVREDAAVA